MTTSPRALMPDYLRLFALFGIAAMKSFSLFSFMFGVGLGFLMRSAERRGLAFGKVYRNRMIGLLLLGVAHGCLFFPGDILVTYAVVGALLYFLRNWSVRGLVRLGVIVLLVQILIVAPLTALGLAVGGEKLVVDPEVLALEREVLTNGSLAQVVVHRAETYLETLPYILFFQGFMVLGWFALGLAAVKGEIIDLASHRIWRRARVYFLWPGVLGSLIAAWHLQWGNQAIGAGLIFAAAPIATIGYLGVIAQLSRPPGPMMSKALAAGGNSLSIYLGQSIILSSVFAGYGFGLWGELGHFAVVLIAIVVTVLLILGLVRWLRYFKLGPFEWVLRKFTYMGAAR